MLKPVSITFLPDDITISASVGDTILDAALDNGITLAHDCGGNCACTTCHIRVESGAAELSPMEETEFDRLQSAEGISPASRLGCQALLLGGSVVVTIEEIW